MSENTGGEFVGPEFETGIPLGDTDLKKSLWLLCLVLESNKWKLFEICIHLSDMKN